MLLVVAHEIIGGESVVRGDEIHARPGPPPIMVEHIRRGAKSLRDRARTRLAFPIITYRIAIPVVPFRPTGRETAHLVSAGSAIPGLRNQLHRAQHRILMASLQESTLVIKAIRL